jgi:hypothetical protein
MRAIEVSLSFWFDLTDRLVALMLGRPQISVEDAITVYENLAREVFSETKLIHLDGRFKASRLERVTKTIVSERSTSNTPEEPRKDTRVPMCRT